MVALCLMWVGSGQSRRQVFEDRKVPAGTPAPDQERPYGPPSGSVGHGVRAQRSNCRYARAMPKRLGYALGLFAVVAATATAEATMEGDKQVTLSQVDSAKIAHVACVAPHGGGIEHVAAYSLALSGAPIHVIAYCRSHGKTRHGNPVRYVVGCDNSTDAWNCGAHELEVDVRLADRMVEVMPVDVSPDDAQQIVLDVADDDIVGVDRITRAVAFTSPCVVTPDSSETWSVVCEWSEMKVIRSCTDGTCEYQAIEFDRRFHDSYSYQNMAAADRAK